jgi:hypothetical protein
MSDLKAYVGEADLDSCEGVDHFGEADLVDSCVGHFREADIGERCEETRSLSVDNYVSKLNDVIMRKFKPIYEFESKDEEVETWRVKAAGMTTLGTGKDTKTAKAVAAMRLLEQLDRPVENESGVVVKEARELILKSLDLDIRESNLEERKVYLDRLEEKRNYEWTLKETLMEHHTDQAKKNGVVDRIGFECLVLL